MGFGGLRARGLSPLCGQERPAQRWSPEMTPELAQRPDTALTPFTLLLDTTLTNLRGRSFALVAESSNLLTCEVRVCGLRCRRRRRRRRRSFFFFFSSSVAVVVIHIPCVLTCHIRLSVWLRRLAGGDPGRLPPLHPPPQRPIHHRPAAPLRLVHRVGPRRQSSP